MGYTGDKKREYQRNWLMKNRREWFQENGPCVDCGSWDNLELDHIDPKKKITHNIWSWAKERRKKELEKCVVRCHDCHTRKTREYKQSNKNVSRIHLQGFTSSYVGVSWDSRAKKYRAETRINGKLKFLGRFDSEEDAAKAYNAARMEQGK